MRTPINMPNVITPISCSQQHKISTKKKATSLPALCFAAGFMAAALATTAVSAQPAKPARDVPPLSLPSWMTGPDAIESATQAALIKALFHSSKPTLSNDGKRAQVTVVIGGSAGATGAHRCLVSLVQETRPGWETKITEWREEATRCETLLDQSSF